MQPTDNPIEEPEDNDTLPPLDPPDATPEGARKYILHHITHQLPAIVGGFLKAARTGSATHMKLVFDFMRSPPPEPPAPAQNTAAILREELRRRAEAGIHPWGPEDPSQSI